MELTTDKGRRSLVDCHKLAHSAFATAVAATAAIALAATAVATTAVAANVGSALATIVAAIVATLGTESILEVPACTYCYVGNF